MHTEPTVMHPHMDRALYPFASHSIEVDGGRMHYIDEGSGPAIVFVHGTPTWSFLFRRLIADLAPDHRVIAPDQIGFGLSDKPRAWSYRPEDHARNLARLIDRLELTDFVLVAHDFGGPIGISCALDRLAQLRGLVLFNSWMWSLADTPMARMSRFLGGPIGRVLYTRMNFSPRVLLPAAYGDRQKLTREVHRHYLAPFPGPEDRIGPWILARELLGSSGWYEQLWSRRAELAALPALLLWGMKDPTFGPEALARWREALPRAEVVEFAEAGHFVPEEAPEGAREAISRCLARME